MHAERAFAVAVFDSLQPLVDALVDSAADAFGPAFDRSEVRWLEETPNGSATQWCRLQWQDQVLLEFQMSQPAYKAHFLTGWSKAPH